MTSKQQKREKINEILAGEIQSTSPVIDRSPLAKISHQKLPSGNVTLLGIALVPIMLGTCILLFALGLPPEKRTMSIELVSLVLIACIFLWLLRCAQKRREFKKAINALVETPLRELEHQGGYLQRYLTNLDERTSRYFHCVTNTKVTNYFILMQIRNALVIKSEEVAALVAQGTAPALIAAFQMLQGNLIFCDGAVANTGNTHVLPLARLAGTVPALIENLELGLKELEGEITQAKSQYISDKKPE